MADEIAPLVGLRDDRVVVMFDMPMFDMPSGTRVEILLTEGNAAKLAARLLKMADIIIREKKEA